MKKNEISFFEHNSIEVLFAYSSHSFPLHSHESFCFGFAEEGDVTFTIAGVRRRLKAGMAFIIPTDTGVKIETDSSYRYVTVCFKKKLKDKLNSYDYTGYYIQLQNADELRECCERFASEDTADSARALFSAAAEAMEPLMEVSDKRDSMSGESDIVRNARRYIIAHADRPFSLQKTAAAGHVSRFYLIKLFKRKMGVTPHQYFIQAKIRRAKDMLNEGAKELDISTMLNFVDQSQLCNIFRKEMGISPDAYQKHYRKKD